MEKSKAKELAPKFSGQKRMDPQLEDIELPETVAQQEDDIIDPEDPYYNAPDEPAVAGEGP